MKIACPICQVRLQIDSEKLQSDVSRFRCPQCKSVLKLKRSTNQKESGDQVFMIAPEERREFVRDIEGGKVRTKGSRRYKRRKFKKKVLVDNQIMVDALDISEEGIFLHTGRDFPDGSVLDVSIPLSGGREMAVKATVQYHQKGIGMGLKFKDLGQEHKKELCRIVEGLEKKKQVKSIGGKTVLLAGGSDTTRRINRSKLLLDGFNVFEAKTHVEILDMIQAQNPQVIVLDWQGTEIEGTTFLSKIRQSSRSGDISIVVLSALTDSAVQKAILAAGADLCLAKMETNPAKLSQTLKDHLKYRAAVKFRKE